MWAFFSDFMIMCWTEGRIFKDSLNSTSKSTFWFVSCTRLCLL